MKPGVSERRVCQVFRVSRSVARVGSEERERRRPPVDELLAAGLQRLIEEHPNYG